MSTKWSIERYNDHLDVRAHGRLEATFRLPGYPNIPEQKVHVSQSGGVRALPSIPVQHGTELIVQFEGVKVVVTMESEGEG